MTHDQILNKTLKSILSYVDHNEYPEIEKKLKLILENLMLDAKREILREINERR